MEHLLGTNCPRKLNGVKLDMLGWIRYVRLKLVGKVKLNQVGLLECLIHFSFIYPNIEVPILYPIYIYYSCKFKFCTQHVLYSIPINFKTRRGFMYLKFQQNGHLKMQSKCGVQIPEITKFLE